MKNKVLKFMLKSVPAAMLTAGIALSTYGVGRIFEPAGFIWLGLLLIILSWPTGGD